MARTPLDPYSTVFAIPGAQVNNPTYIGKIPWTVASRRLNFLGKQMGALTRNWEDILAGMVLEKVVADILSGNSGVEPLNDKWKAYKQKQGWSEHPLVRTGEYVRSLGVQRVNAFKVHIGPDPTKTDSRGIPYTEIMVMLEFGTERMPARPHIQPAANKVAAIAGPQLKEIMRRDLKKMVLK